ncbi:nitrilase-related carbon-nitrogen hydrolase [Glutamicibacter uratoxydans]|uniref:nitrilase-related carbon-nitrogen hydrolase n=1 Tax=Glutamicibacter uratoxydans TaxID=43667 RepID=UPI003D6DCF70
MRLAVLQHESTSGDWEKNLARLEESLQLAATNRVDVLLTPELYLTGADPHAVLKNFSASSIAGLHQHLTSLSASYGVALAYSLPEFAADRVFIGSFFLDDRGHQLASYTRVHLATASERQHFNAGQSPPQIFEFHHTKMALTCGYDAQFPENVRFAAAAGAKIVFVPAAAEVGAAALALKLLPARAMENGIYLLWANHCSVQGQMPMTGRSTIIGPDGQNIQLAGRQPQLIVADMDRLRQQAVRKAAPYLSQLRPELYRES